MAAGTMVVTGRGAWNASLYSSSGAEQRARSVLFMEQYQREGSLWASTTPRSRRHCFDVVERRCVAV